jgi:hypothetical protein
LNVIAVLGSVESMQIYYPIDNILYLIKGAQGDVVEGYENVYHSQFNVRTNYFSFDK